MAGVAAFPLATRTKVQATTHKVTIEGLRLPLLLARIIRFSCLEMGRVWEPDLTGGGTG